MYATLSLLLNIRSLYLSPYRFISWEVSHTKDRYKLINVSVKFTNISCLKPHYFKTLATINKHMPLSSKISSAKPALKK
jgi:hypothetical protein